MKPCFDIRKYKMVKIKIKKINSSAKLPKCMTQYSAGYDIYSCNEEDIVMQPGEVELIPTGIAVSLPHNYEAQIRPRSGLAFKHKISVLNSPGTIDSDYRGEVKVILFNFGKSEFIIAKHTRIAQMVVTKHETIEFEVCEQLDNTDRGAGGFGHTEF